MLRAIPRATARRGEKIRQVARMKWKITRNPNRERATAAGAMPLKGTLAAIPTLFRLPWISSQSVHRTGYTPRFPPAEITDEEGEEGEVRTHRNFATVRFETYEADPSMVWMEVASEYMLYPDEIALADNQKITDHVQETYDFLTHQCIEFLNQFDKELPSDSQADGESES